MLLNDVERRETQSGKNKEAEGGAKMREPGALSPSRKVLNRELRNAG